MSMMDVIDLPEELTPKQAAFLMRHLSPTDRNRMIADADNVIDARKWFAATDKGSRA